MSNICENCEDELGEGPLWCDPCRGAAVRNMALAERARITARIAQVTTDRRGFISVGWLLDMIDGVDNAPSNDGHEAERLAACETVDLSDAIECGDREGSP